MLDAPEATAFIARYPAFASVDAGVLALVLAEATAQVDETWILGDQIPAMMLYAAHILTLEGFGTNTVMVGETAMQVNGIITQMSAGDHSFTFGNPGRPSIALRTASELGLSETIFGRRFAELLRRNSGDIAVCY